MGIALPPIANRRGFNALPIAIVTFCLLWSSAFAAAKLTLAYSPPLLLLAARFLLAAAVMLAAVGLRGKGWRIDRRDLIVFAVLGIFNNAVYLGLNYVGMQTTSAGVTAIISSANPVLTALLAAFFLSEPLTWRKAAGLLLGVGGVVFIVQSRISGKLEDPVGIACTVAGLLSLVTGTILFKRLAPKSDLWVGNAIQNSRGRRGVAPAFSYARARQRRGPGLAAAGQALPIRRCWFRSSATCCGFICCGPAARPARAPIIF